MTGTPPWFPQAVSPVISLSSLRFLAQILRDCSLTFCRSHVCSTPRSSRASDAAAARSATLHRSVVTRSASRSSSLLFHSGIAAAAVQRIHTARTHASTSSHEDFAHRPALPSLPLFFCSFFSQRSALPRAWPASFSLVCFRLLFSFLGPWVRSTVRGFGHPPLPLWCFRFHLLFSPLGHLRVRARAAGAAPRPARVAVGASRVQGPRSHMLHMVIHAD